jgi:hypothetical protein
VTGWHVDKETLARYGRGQVGLSVGASVEAHLLACARCRKLLTPAADLDRLARLWEGVVDRVDAPRPGAVERLLRLVGVSGETSRLLATTPTLRVPWLLATAAALAFAVFAAASTGGSARGTLLFLVVAPILPVAGVAIAFRPGLDPTYEIGLAAPYSHFRLLLLRSAAVTAVTCAAAFVVGVVLPTRALTAAAWLLPALALTSLTLALARRLAVAWAAAAVGGFWTVTVVASHVRIGQFVAFGLAGQLACVAIAAVSVIVLATDRNRYAPRLGGV